MPLICRVAVTLLLLAAGSVLPLRAEEPLAPEQKEPLTPQQKQAVEQVIHDYFMKHPEFMVDVLRAAEAKLKEAKAENAREAIAAKHDEIFADSSSPVGGNPGGDVTIVEFFDYSCPYCKQVEPQLETLLKQDPKIRIVYKEFPVLGPGSVYAASMALAAQQQGKYAAFHDMMMATKGQITEPVVLKVAAQAGLDVAKAKGVIDSPAVKDIIKRNYALADALEINGTPAFVIGDVLVNGATTIDNLKKLVADARKPS